MRETYQAHVDVPTIDQQLLDSLASLGWRLSLGPLRVHRFGHGNGAAVDEADAADVLAAIREKAAAVHEWLGHDNDVFAAEFLGATGSGKTALIEQLLARTVDAEVAVVAGDVAGDDDAKRYRSQGVRAVDVTTGKDCHLDPDRVAEALDELDLAALDRLFVENVGNMVCPAEFPLGADCRVVVVSVTEGVDVIRKHPLLFQACDLAVINKVDIADAVGVDVDRMVADLDRVASELSVVRTSAKTGLGIAELEAKLRGHRTYHDSHEH